MKVGLETATQSSMRIGIKTLDTRPKYLGYIYIWGLALIFEYKGMPLYAG